MLIQIDLTNGERHAVNPLYIKRMYSKRGVTVLRGSFGTDWSNSLRTYESFDSLCARIDEAMMQLGPSGVAAAEAVLEEDCLRAAAAGAGLPGLATVTKT